MPVHKPFRMRILKSTKILKTERRSTTVERIREKPTTAEIVIAFKKASGYEDVIARIPKAATNAGWQRSSCEAQTGPSKSPSLPC
jgi:hypothetical protein